ncbi:hypothetical protein HOO65_020327 [Ceratocystis lukuohia]|uniref:Phosphoglycerate mutase family protein n=1 Tax=Ceratocystis lukuohia TaxID=2019550 RepID=A0ABR4MND5_9PEZI
MKALLLVLCVALAVASPMFAALPRPGSFSASKLVVSAAAPAPQHDTGFVEATKSKPTVYLIRHGEKPKEGNGLSAKGIQRAECLKSLFGKDSKYDIGHIMAQKPKKNGRRKRPYDTVKPLADHLDIEVDTSCPRDDMECVKDTIKNYEGKGNILVCWEHKRLTKIVKTLGLKHHDAPHYPSKHFDIIWTDPPKYHKLDPITYESCPAIYDSEDDVAPVDDGRDNDDGDVKNDVEDYVDDDADVDADDDDDDGEVWIETVD